jgi:hypothetical protein
VDPLSPAASRDACTPDDLARAQVVLAQIQAAANAYAAGAPFPTNPNLTIIGHGDRRTTTWYLEIRPAFGGARPGSAGPSAAGAGASSGPRPGGFGGPGGYGGPSVGPPPTGPIVVGPSSVAPQPRRSPSPENRARFETIRSSSPLMRRRRGLQRRGLVLDTRRRSDCSSYSLRISDLAAVASNSREYGYAEDRRN